MKIKFFTIFFVIVTQTTNAQIPSDNLISNYEFETGSLLTDSQITNGQNLTQNGNVLAAIPNRFNTNPTSAIDINGDYLTRPDIDYGLVGNDETYVTLSFWLKTGTNVRDTQIIIDETDRSNINDTNWHGYYVALKDGKIDLGVNYQVRDFLSNVITERSLLATATNTISDNLWHHVVIEIRNFRLLTGSGTYNIQYFLEIYVDNVLNGSQTQSDNGPLNITISHDVNTGFGIANNADGNFASVNQYQDGFDDLRIYNRRLSDADRDLLFYEGTCNPVALVTAENISFNSANIVLDNSVNFTSWDLSYIETGSSATPTTISNITTQSQSISILNSLTDYDVTVTGTCSLDNSITWSNTITLTTTIPPIYVDVDNQSSTKDGQSWATAYSDLQQAIVSASTDSQIWIADGFYTRNSNTNTFDIVTAKEGLKIYGGFNGTEVLFSDRDFRTNITILSADVNGDDGPNFTNRADNANRVIAVQANNVILDGITITGGYALTGNTADFNGAGILKTFAAKSLFIRNCIIKDNYARSGGAGIYDLVSSINEDFVLEVSGTKFINNRANFGTGIYLALNNNDSNYTVNINNSLFEGNEAGDFNGTGVSGSAIYLRALASGNILNAKIINNVFYGNIDSGTNASIQNLTPIGIDESNGSPNLSLEFFNNINRNNVDGTGALTPIMGSVLGTDDADLIINNNFADVGFMGFNAATTTLTNNSTADPLFTDQANSDFTLQQNSPAIDFGDSTQISSSQLFDLGGNQRIVGNAVDAGAFEFNSVLSLNTVDNDLEFKIYPNPTHTTLNILSTAIVKNIQIFSVLGKQVKTIHNSNTIDISELENGIYLAKIHSETGIITKRFIKQ